VQRYVNAAQGLPRPSDLEFVLFEKTPPDKVAAALLTLAQGLSRPTMGPKSGMPSSGSRLLLGSLISYIKK
jgi:hypothetical protein